MKSRNGKTNKKVTFCVETQPGSEVFVAGTFNNWNPSEHRLRDNPDDGVFKIALSLPPGQHEYKFLVNDEWRLDPKCPDWIPNDIGTLNSVVRV